MIIEWFFTVLVNVQTWFLGLFPPWDPPAFMAQLDTNVNGFFANFTGLGVWGDWPYLSAVFMAVLGTWLVGLIIKALRAVASYIPLFGGAG